MEKSFCLRIARNLCRSPPLVLRFHHPTKTKEDRNMAKPYKIPDFRKMYPEASEEVIAVLRTTKVSVLPDMTVSHSFCQKT